MPVTITQERPDHPDTVMLVDELQAHLAPQYPVESQYGLSVDQLLRNNVTFFVLRSDGTPAACGGVQLFGTEYGELKRMYVRPQFRGSGFGKAILNQLAAHAQAHGVPLLRLETGIHQTEAIGLYEGMGFYRISPFGDYREDPLSLCFEKPI